MGGTANTIVHPDLSEGPAPAAAKALMTAHAADVAEWLNALDPARAAELLAELPLDHAVHVIEQPEFERRARLFRHLHTPAAVEIFKGMSPDQQADLVRELHDADRAGLLVSMDRARRRELEELLAYPLATAGSLMTTDYLSVPMTWTAGQTLDRIRTSGSAPRPVYAIYVVDPADNRLVHVVSLRELVMAEPTADVIEVGPRRRVLSVTPLTDQEDVARLLSKYNLLAVPVADEQGRLLGTITVDDVIDAVVREQTEDVQRFGGMEALDEPYTKITLPRMIRKRAGWLCALFLGEMLTATAMQHFELQLSKALVLSLFIPLIMSSGGNSGSQATSLIVRALALGEVRLRDWWRVAAREVPTSLTLGTILGLIGFVRIAAWQQLGIFDYGVHWMLVAATVGTALVGVVMFGSLVGAMLPFVLRRLGFDPASASAPFVATLVDVTGLVIYFGVAYLILRGTLL
jgi:magnesium transporter